MQGVARQVVGIVYYMCRVVALYLQHELQIVAQVVLAEAQGGRQSLLILTACYAAYQPNFCTVVEAYSIQCLDERERGVGAGGDQPAVVGERVSGFSHLQAAGH